jgi:Fe-S-cluster-containing dehydrogenase component/DMSO reductase anchor subunit
MSENSTPIDSILNKESNDTSTPIESFINHKADTGMQCGNYSIDIPELKEGEQYRFHFDLTACVGCHCCEVACNEQNGNDADVKWRRVGEMEGGTFPDVSQLFNSMSCNHCIDPACLNGCPTESYIKLDNGIVFHEDESCIGCQYCTWNCPYEVPVMNYDRGIVTKCHMCVDKLEVGETPACVQACPAGAINIEVVNKEQWLNEDMNKEGIAPHLPDTSITKPTTRYTVPSNMDEINYSPADEHITKPAHSELPLVFMTVLTQMSVGGFVALFFGELLNMFGFNNLASANYILAAFIILPALIGLPLSALHLGRPLLAHTAMKNWRKSWLSREALALAIYAGSTIGVILSYYYEINSILTLLMLLSLTSGVYGIYAQSMIYRIKARPSWDRESTTKRFMASGYLGLILVAFILTAQGYGSSAMAILSITILGAAYQVLVIFEEKVFYKYLGDKEKNYYQLNKTKTLLENNFKSHLKMRFNTLIGFGIILPIIATIFLANGNINIASIMLAISLLGSTISELVGRYLFYVTVVPLGLAGNFFAGNQRGRDYKEGSH